MKKEKRSCANCKHSRNIQHTSKTEVSWDCHELPMLGTRLEGSFKLEFETFNCSKWATVFEKQKNRPEHEKAKN